MMKNELIELRKAAQKLRTEAKELKVQEMTLTNEADQLEDRANNRLLVLAADKRATAKALREAAIKKDAKLDELVKKERPFTEKQARQMLETAKEKRNQALELQNERRILVSQFQKIEDQVSTLIEKHAEKLKKEAAELEKEAGQEEEQEKALAKRPNRTLALFTAAAMLAGCGLCYALSRDGGITKITQLVKPTIEKPVSSPTTTTTAPVQSNKQEVIAKINTVLHDYNQDQAGNAELAYNYMADNKMTIDDYTDSIEIVAAVLIDSYRKGDTRMLDMAIASQKTPEATEEMMAVKAFVEPYLKNPNIKNMGLLTVGAKKSLNDGLTRDFRMQKDTSVHEQSMLYFSMAWPVAAENGHQIKYDEKQIEQQWVSDIPLAIDGPVWVHSDTVIEQLNKEFELVVNDHTRTDCIDKGRTK